jgi:hypothetical protein
MAHKIVLFISSTSSGRWIPAPGIERLRTAGRVVVRSLAVTPFGLAEFIPKHGHPGREREKH